MTPVTAANPFQCRKWGSSPQTGSQAAIGRSFPLTPSESEDCQSLKGTMPSLWWLSQTALGCVTRHARHASVTHFRPISGNILEVTLVTSPKHVYNSHAKETYFP